jgi:hypothetical protein
MIVILIVIYLHFTIETDTSGYNLLASIVHDNIPSHERQALYDLYVSTDGDDWIYLDGDQGHWNFTDPDVNPCSSSDPWQGLNCTVISSDTNSYYYISEIKLSYYNLIGTIPEYREFLRIILFEYFI